MLNLNQISSEQKDRLIAFLCDRYVMDQDDVGLLISADEGWSYRKLASIRGDVSHQWVATRVRSARRKRREILRFIATLKVAEACP